MGGKSVRRDVLFICVLAGIGGALFAQSPRTQTEGSAQDALLAEVRMLRAEIHQMASASIRAQLLVAHLQLQEQRVLTVARQLAEAQTALATVRQEIASERARVRQLEDAAARATGQNRAGMQRAIVDATTQIELQQRHELQLQARETELLKAGSEAQGQWSDFNDRLDAIARSLPTSVSR